MVNESEPSLQTNKNKFGHNPLMSYLGMLGLVNHADTRDCGVAAAKRVSVQAGVIPTSPIDPGEEF